MSSFNDHLRELLISRQLIDFSVITSYSASAGMVSQEYGFLTKFLHDHIQDIQETQWLQVVLASHAMTSIVLPYIPCPGTEEGSPLCSDSEFFNEVDPLYHRQKAWYVGGDTTNNRTIVILSYDPWCYTNLLTGDYDNFWLMRAVELGFLKKSEVSNVKIIRGVTSIHQFLARDHVWRKFPILPQTASTCEAQELEPYYESDTTVYVWCPIGRETDRRLHASVCNLLYKEVVMTPRMYPGRLGSFVNAEGSNTKDVVTSDPTVQLWREWFVNILEETVLDGDSDIHIGPNDSGGLSVGIRQSGDEQFVRSIPAYHVQPFYKAALLGTGVEHSDSVTLGKDGRATIYCRRVSRAIDLRYSIMAGKPPSFLPKIIVRVLDPANVRKGIFELVRHPKDVEMWKWVTELNNGICLVTGPTGSGKSVTLYSLLQTLHQLYPGYVFNSAEDPVEYILGSWIHQTSIDHKTGGSFAHHMRQLLRSDPDVIFVGEIRDKETAQIAIEAALTGHIVFSTIHVKDCYEVPSRFEGLGVNMSDVARVLRLTSAQRLVGLACPECARREMAPPELVERMGGAPFEVTVAAGCDYCKFRGYKGRMAVQEFLQVPETDQQLISAVGRGDSFALKKAMADRGISNLQRRAVELSIDGLVPLSEVLRMG